MEIWTEKYRPKSLNNVIGQKEIVERLKAFVINKNIPHLLFAGPAGVGKTTCALALAHDLFGDNWRENFLELNASNDRGIDVIRNQVKDFARTKPIGNIPFKIIFLGESDALTREAQQALRRTMEMYSKTCRFVLDCNYSSKIIDPIQSRCAVFRFKPLSEEEVVNYLLHISKQENLSIFDPNVLRSIYRVSNGDMRKAINLLQSCAATGKEITEDLVYSVASYAKPNEIKDLINLALNGNFNSSRKKMYEIMYYYGLSSVGLLKQIQQLILELENIDDKLKLKIIERLGEYEFRMVEGADPYIQLESFLAYLVMVKNDVVQ